MVCKVGKIFDEHGFHDKPSYIYNCDETSFQPEQNEIRIITKTTTRNPFKLASNNPKTTYTVLVCGNAIGEYLPLNFIFKGKNLYSDWTKDGPKGAQYGKSKSGWMEGEQFRLEFKKPS